MDPGARGVARDRVLAAVPDGAGVVEKFERAVAVFGRIVDEAISTIGKKNFIGHLKEISLLLERVDL